jgi:hypothetical protein
MRHEESDGLVVAMKAGPMKHRTCASGGRLWEEKTWPSEGVLVWKELRPKNGITQTRQRSQQGSYRRGKHASWEGKG